jgi:hypothetical protein
MRGMNMLQMLGGVAVAGAVAAGTTAFTATGLAAPASVTIGGNADINTFTDLTISNVQIKWDTTVLTKIAGITVTFTGAPDGTNVTVKATDSVLGSEVFTCGVVTSDIATCTISAFTPTVISHIIITA